MSGPIPWTTARSRSTRVRTIRTRTPTVISATIARWDYNFLQDNFDHDGVGDVCDLWIFVQNPSQTDLDFDFIGDHCELDDGVRYVILPDKITVAWQEEVGFDTWNWYKGDYSAFVGSGAYTQDPSSSLL